VASLTRRLARLEEDAAFHATPARAMPFDGFGKFDSMLLNTRSASLDGSPFNAARTAARSRAPDPSHAWPRGAA
jgi:hypothetical protein